MLVVGAWDCSVTVGEVERRGFRVIVRVADEAAEDEAGAARLAGRRGCGGFGRRGRVYC